MRPFVITAAALCAALGCTTARPVLPGANPTLPEGEGFLVLDLVTDVQIARLECSGVIAAHDIPPGEHLVLLAIDAGAYRWNRVSFSGPDGELRLELGRDGPWKFRVEPGRISYPGNLVFRGAELLWTAHRLEARSLNRSSMAFHRLEKLYPELLGRYPILYTGHHRDDFLERYAAALGAARRTAARPPAP